VKLRLEVEVEYDGDVMHGTNPESIEWFRDCVLLQPEEDEQLILHSNCIGDMLGPCKVLRIIEGL